MKLRKLYSIPALIDPVEFEDGLNIIVGEKDDSSDKTNGVGKSLSIEFINYALLKRKSDSRVSNIPKEILPPDTIICLDFIIGGDFFTLKRSVLDSEAPVIIENGYEVKYSKIEDATRYLTEKLFNKQDIDHPNFRIMLGPIIRDEKSEFKSLIGCYDTEKRIADDYAPHLYLLGIDIGIYKRIKELLIEIDSILKDITRIKEHVQLIRQKEINDARSDLNELDEEVRKIQTSIDKLENISGYEIVKNDILSIEERIDSLRRKKAISKQKLIQLKPISQKVEIDLTEVTEFYEQLKSGLGNLISKNISEVLQFKKKIDDFQNKLIFERRNVLEVQISDYEEEIFKLDKTYSEYLSVLNQEGGLRNLKQTYAAYQEKSEQLSQLRAFVNRFDELEADKQRAKSEKEIGLLQLQADINNQKVTIEGVEKTILSIHEFIQGNRQASFNVKHTSKKQVIEIDMRIDSDGSHSVDREKVFIYDISLLLNAETSKRHPNFLIHDNIFDVDNDTLEKSLRYLFEKADLSNSQYIVTINSDRLGIDFMNELNSFIRARYTKKSRFLKKNYQQKK